MSKPRQTASPRELLVPYIEWLRERCLARDLPSDAGETKISFGQKSISLDPWAIEQLQRSLGQATKPDEHDALLIEIVALLLKCMADTERFAAASTGKVDQYYRLQAELMLDSNLGNSLISRTQRVVDTLVQQGMTQDARQLSGVLHKLRRSMVEVNRNAGTKVATPHRAVEWTADPSEADDSEAVDRAQSTDPDTETLSYPVPSSIGSGRTRFLCGVLVLALGIWLVAVELPKLFGSLPPELRISDLQAPAVELSVHSRWPVLYVEVRDEAWSTLDPEERERLVADLVENATLREFASILVRTMDGRSLVQWWRGSDVRWADTPVKGKTLAAGAETPDAIETGQPPS